MPGVQGGGCGSGGGTVISNVVMCLFWVVLVGGLRSGARRDAHKIAAQPEVQK